MYDATLDLLCTLAAEKAARGGNTVRFAYLGRPGEIVPLTYGPDWPEGPLDEVLRDPLFAAYPSGLVLPIQRVNWFWSFPKAYLIGNAEQAERLCARERIDPGTVFAISADRVHGTCAREEVPGKAHYRLVQARSFPAFCGV